MQPLLYTRAHRVLFRSLLNGLEQYKAFSRSQCDQRLKNPKHNGVTDVFSHLSQTFNPKTERPLYTRVELGSESSLLIVAGSDTTSTCLAATFFYLLHNPEAFSLAQNEIDKTFQCLEDIRSGQRLSACHYLRACINESLRLSPPVGGLMAREVLTGGLEVDGHLFPKGVEIETPHYALHHDEEYYPEPFLYKPERWLAAEGSEAATARSAFCPFSIGPRGCVGKTMAYHELMIVMGRVLWEFDIRLDDRSELRKASDGWKGFRQRADEYQLYDTFSSKSMGPQMQFRPRRRAATGW